MVDFQYAKGRIEESIDFISKEMEEFEKDYAAKDWKEYKQNNKLQKLNNVSFFEPPARREEKSDKTLTHCCYYK